jgi:amidase
MALDDDYDDLDATAMASLVRNGEVQARELIDAAIDRAEARDPELNAIVHRQFDRAREDCGRVDPAAPFGGVPFLFKDYAGWEAGEPYRMGVRTLRDEDYRPTVDSAYARRIRDSGFVPIGRTNTPELAVMGTTEPQLWGPTHNPWAPGRSPGGSSGGSAAAVAARIVPVAHANDISGSIRLPAAMCGIVGLKPTRGRVVMSEVDTPIGMGVEGVVTRTVRDTAAVVSLLSHRSPWWPAPGWDEVLTTSRRPNTLRIGVWTEAFNGSPVDEQCAAGAEHAADALAQMGHSVERTAPAVLASEELWELAKTALSVSAAAEAQSWTARIGRPLGADDLEPRTWSMVEAGSAVSAAELHAVLGRMQELSREAHSWWDEFDLLVTPTTAAPPSPHGEYLTRYVSGLGSAFTRPINVTGQPAISVPFWWPDDGLPRGVQLVGQYGADQLLVSVAAALELAEPWSDRRPAIASTMP